MSGGDITWKLLASLLMVAVCAPAYADPAATDDAADCKKLQDYTLKTNIKADPEVVRECERRGWSPPPKWKINEGKNSGIRAGGSTGFSYGTVAAPDTTGKSRNARASATKARINFSCNFPPRIKIGIPPSISVPKGSCWDFFAGLLKDKDSGTTIGASAPVAGTNEGACAAEEDTTGAYGTRTALTGGTIPLQCGGMVPTTSLDMVLNANPTGLATTESFNGQNYIWIYRKSGASYDLVASKVLPTYLCKEITVGEGTTMQKSVDLTAPLPQMITFNGSSNHISIRLKSRASMDSGFIPPYSDIDPEKYLIIPIDGAGTPTIPNDCDKDSDYYQTLSSQQDIVVHSSTVSGCESVAMTATPINSPTSTCPTGSTPDPTTGKCMNSSGQAVPALIKDSWNTVCPSGNTVPVGTPCPESAGIPANAACASGTTGNQPNENCSTSSLKVTGGGAICTGKTQYSVLNRPNLYYPPATTPNFTPITGRSQLMADTVSGSRFYAQSQTELYLAPTAPAMTLHEGGIVRFNNGTMLIMKAETILDAASKKVTLPHGAQLVGIDGAQIQAFNDGDVYTMPLTAADWPLKVNLNLSMSLPAGFSVPTAPKSGNLVPYVRLPADAPPK